MLTPTRPCRRCLAPHSRAPQALYCSDACRRGAYQDRALAAYRAVRSLVA